MVTALALLLALGLLFAITVAPSPRDGVQPVEFMDNAFYAILGRDLIATGTEAFYSPAGLIAPAGVPAQTWYHWGELWLAGGAGWLFGVEPMPARHVVTLPLLLVAAAALGGSIVCVGSGLASRATFAFGAVAILLLAPVPLPGNYFTTSPAGLLHSISTYGVAAVQILFLMLIVVRARSLVWTPRLSLFIAAVAAMVLPSHVVLFILGLGAATVAVAVHGVQAWRRHPGSMTPPREWLVLSGLVVLMLFATLGWGLATGHGVMSGGVSPTITRFGPTWRLAIATTFVGSFLFLAIPVAWWISRRRRADVAALMVVAMSAVAAGGLAWGLLFADFNMFHAYFGGIVAFATAPAVLAIVVVWRHLKAQGRQAVAFGLAIISVVCVDIGVASSAYRLVQFGPIDYEPIPLDILAAVRRSEPGSRIGYVCHPYEEIAVWDQRLLSIDVHTGRRVVPLCYQADLFATMLEPGSRTYAMNPSFRYGPQVELFPTADAAPSQEQVLAFMRAQGIDYLFVDAAHPNTLVPDAVRVLGAGQTELLRVP